MSGKSKVAPSSIANLHTSNNSKEISKSELSAQTSQKKFIYRKPINNISSFSSGSKKTSQQPCIVIESPRYMINSPVKNVPITYSINSEDLSQQPLKQDIKTERKDLLVHQKSIDKSVKSKKYNDDSAEYYKYWKMKANQYQEQNFNLHRLNSSLQQQNQILKHKLQKMQKKLVRMQPEQIQVYDKNKNYEKLQKYYLSKVDQMSKKISQQELLIGKQEKKIKELSKFLSQNYQLKNILNNMQQKINEMKSADHTESGKNSFSRLSSQQGQKRENDHLELPEWNRAVYGIKDKKQLDHAYEHKLTKGKSYY